MDMNNVMVLRDLIVMGGGRIAGRKKMQKIFYIIQELVDPFKPPFEYGWNYFGVYSDSLTAAIRIGEYFNMFEEVPVYQYGYRSYALKVIDVEDKTDITEDEKLEELMVYLNSKEPRLLEVLSSILYFKKQDYSKDEIDALLHEYKGHLTDFFEQAYIDLEKAKGILQ